MTQTFKKRIGSKAEVYHGTCKETAGGLKKSDLVKTKKGRIVSKKQRAAGLRAIKHLYSMGYKPTKGKFVAMRKSMVDGRRHSKSSRRQTRKRGGAAGIPNMPKLPDASGNAK